MEYLPSVKNRGTLCTVWSDGQDILSEKAKCRIMGIIYYYSCRTTNKNKYAIEYIIVYACRSSDYLWKGKQDISKNFLWGG